MSNSMTSKERLMAAINRKEVDRIPWSPLVDPYYTSSLPMQGLHIDVIDTLKYIGGDLILRHDKIHKPLFKNIEYKSIKKGNEEYRIFDTPVGTVKSIYCYTGKTSYKKEYYIKSIEDLKVMQYVAENTSYELDLEQFAANYNRIGDDGLTSTDMPVTPIQQLMQHEMGIEGFTFMLFDYRNEIKEYLDVLHINNLKISKLISDSPEMVELVFQYEDTSTTVMSPAWYEEFCMTNIDEYVDIIKDGGKKYITHMCGKLKGMQSVIKDGKMDGIDSVCPPTTGDLWAYEALNNMPGKVIIGGIEPSALLRMSVNETNEYVSGVIEKTKPYPGFILSTGDATAFGTPIQNLIAISKLVNKIGSYN